MDSSSGSTHSPIPNVMAISCVGGETRSSQETELKVARYQQNKIMSKCMKGRDKIRNKKARFIHRCDTPFNSAHGEICNTVYKLK